MKGIWIIGTDTEIGKTTVAAALLQALRAEGLSPAMVKPVQTGEFGADMKVELLNDGPVTILMDTKNKE